MSDIDDLKSVFISVAQSQNSEPKLYLAIENGKWVAKQMTWFERMQRGIGMGPFVYSTIQKKLQEDRIMLQKMANEMLDEGVDIQPIQDVINRQFESTGRSHNSIDLYENRYKNWMSTLTQEVKQKKINEIFLPGSHDSGAYKVDFSTPLATSFLHGLARFAGKYLPFAGSIIKNWTITQDKDIKGQLEQGIRALDLRIARNPNTGEFYLSHTFACVPLKEVLEQINQFLKENPEEVIVINMKPDWDHKEGMDDHEVEMLNSVNNILGSLLLKPNEKNIFDDSTTIANMVANNKRVLFNYQPRKLEQIEKSNINIAWIKKNIGNFWDDVSKIKEKINKLKEGVTNIDTAKERYGYNENYNDVSMARTPQPKDIVKSVFTNFFRPAYKKKGLYYLSKKMPTVADKFITKNEKLLKDRHITTLSADFVARSGFVHNVIRHNKRSGNR